MGQDDAAKVVVQNASWDALDALKGVLVAGEEYLELFGEGELDVEAAAVAEDEQERREPTRLAFHLDRAARGPVDLCRVAGRERDAKEGLGGFSRADRPDEVGEDRMAADEAQRAGLGFDPDDGQSRVSFEDGSDRVLERIDERGARGHFPARHEALHPNRPAHGFGVDGELHRDLSLRKAFAEVKASDLGPESGVHHWVRCARRAVISRKSTPRRVVSPTRVGVEPGSSST